MKLIHQKIIFAPSSFFPVNKFSPQGDEILRIIIFWYQITIHKKVQKFSFPKTKMQFEPIFLQVLWQFLSARRSRACGRGFLAAEGGEMRSNYLKNTEPVRKLQGFGSRLPPSPRPPIKKIFGEILVV